MPQCENETQKSGGLHDAETLFASWDVAELTAIASLIGTASIAIALTYEVGYFLFFGYRLASYLSIQDAITDAIYVIPPVAAIILTFHYLTPRRFAEIVATVSSSRRPILAWAMVIVPTVLILVFAVAALNIFRGKFDLSFTFLLLFGGVLGIPLVIALPYRRNPRHRHRMVVLYSLVALMVTFVSAAFSGKKDIDEADLSDLITLRSVDKPLAGTVLKTGSSHTIFLTAGKRVTVVPTADIERVERVIKPLIIWGVCIATCGPNSADPSRAPQS